MAHPVKVLDLLSYSAPGNDFSGSVGNNGDATEICKLRVSAPEIIRWWLGTSGKAQGYEGGWVEPRRNRKRPQPVPCPTC